MFKKITAILTAVVTLASCTGKAQSNKNSDIVPVKGGTNRSGYRCVSNGFRQPLKWAKASQPRIISRYRRKAMVDMKGKLKLVFPTYYMSRIKPDRHIREYPFPNDVRIQAGIEPSYKMSNKNLDTSPRIVGETVTYRKGDKESYKIITIDLGDRVIKKGSWYGIWVALENLDGKAMVPYSRTLGSSKEQIFESSYTSAPTSYIADDFIRKAKKLPLVPVTRRWGIGFSPVAILAKTDYKGDIWGVLGSSIPEGWYDIYGNQQGDENSNLGYADKLFSTRIGVPSVNLSKGSDRLEYCATESKGRQEIMKLCGVTHVHLGLGGNDLSHRMSVKKMEDNCRTIVNSLKKLDPTLCIVGGTIIPRSASTDKFATEKNQKPLRSCGGMESLRGKWNALLRKNPQAGGMDDVYELCSKVEKGWQTNDSIWAKLDGKPIDYTCDGIHPTCKGSAEMAKNAYLIKGSNKAK